MLRRIETASKGTRTTKNLSRRGSNSVGVHLGNLWADLFEAFASFLSVDSKSSRKEPLDPPNPRDKEAFTPNKS